MPRIQKLECYIYTTHLIVTENIKKGCHLIELLKTILRFYESHTVHEWPVMKKYTLSKSSKLFR